MKPSDAHREARTRARRLRYAWIAGAALWIGWLASIGLGRGLVDLAGQVVGTDYLEFYTAGYTVNLGPAAEARLYDVAYQASLEQSIAGPRLSAYYAFITPPFLAWLYAPLAGLPYALSFALWTFAGLLLLWASMRLLGAGPGLRPLTWALTFFPVFASFSYGQNSLLSLFLLSLCYRCWRRRLPLAAGLACSLLLYKPQLVAGVALLWLLEWPAGGPERARGRQALAGLALGGSVLAGLCAWLLPEASRGYLVFVRTVLPDLPAWQQFPLWNLHTVRGFWRLLLAGMPGAADILTLAAAALGLAGFLRYRQALTGRPPLLFAGAIALTLWLTPHAMIYDWTLLLIPAVLLWQAAPEGRRRWQALYAITWVGSFMSGQLTALQLRFLPFAVQVSVPLLAAALYLGYRELMARPVLDPGGVLPVQKQDEITIYQLP